MKRVSFFLLFKGVPRNFVNLSICQLQGVRLKRNNRKVGNSDFLYRNAPLAEAVSPVNGDTPCHCYPSWNSCYSCDIPDRNVVRIMESEKKVNNRIVK